MTLRMRAASSLASVLLEYMGLTSGTPMKEIPVDKVFIGSCTNARIEDLRAAAKVVNGKKIASNILRAMIVPGSGLVKEQAEAEGLDKIFTDAGFEWREAGCSMCLGMNPDILSPKERCASTSNRNFEGRQGAQGRTHLMSPAMAATAAIVGKLADVREHVVASPVIAKVQPVIETQPEADSPETEDELDRVLDLPADNEPHTNTSVGGRQQQRRPAEVHYPEGYRRSSGPFER